MSDTNSENIDKVLEIITSNEKFCSCFYTMFGKKQPPGVKNQTETGIQVNDVNHTSKLTHSDLQFIKSLINLDRAGLNNIDLRNCPDNHIVDKILLDLHNDIFSTSATDDNDDKKQNDYEHVLKKYSNLQLLPSNSSLNLEFSESPKPDIKSRNKNHLSLNPATMSEIKKLDKYPPNEDD